MILCAGLTPAWQQVCVFDSFQPGEVNRAREVVWCASGKVFNAGIASHYLGAASLTLAPAGPNAAEPVQREFAALGVPHRLLRTAARTRICTTIIDRATGRITELVENGHPLLAEELGAFCRAYSEEAAKADIVILIGSLPQGVPESLYRELASQTPCRMIADFRGEGLLEVLPLRPYVVKPNREELARTVGRPLSNDAELLSAMRELNARGAQWVVITQGADPVWISSADAAFRVFPPRVEDVVNPIASGDAMAATLAWATQAGRPLPEAARLAVAAAAQNVRQLLPCRLNPSLLESEARDIRMEPV